MAHSTCPWHTRSHLPPHLVALLALVEEQRGIAAQLLDARLPVLRRIQRRLEHAQRGGAVLEDLAAPAQCRAGRNGRPAASRQGGRAVCKLTTAASPASWASRPLQSPATCTANPPLQRLRLIGQLPPLIPRAGSIRYAHSTPPEFVPQPTLHSQPTTAASPPPAQPAAPPC